MKKRMVSRIMAVVMCMAIVFDSYAVRTFAEELIVLEKEDLIEVEGEYDTLDEYKSTDGIEDTETIITDNDEVMPGEELMAEDYYYYYD